MMISCLVFGIIAPWLLVQGIQLTSVPDGVIVESKGEIKVIKTIIHTYVEIDTHPVSQLKEEYLALANKIAFESAQAQGQGAMLDPTMDELIRWRTRRLKEGLGTLNKRKRRGLFSFVGEVGKGLFGLVTSDDVERVRQGVNARMRNQQTLVRTQKGLVKVVSNLKTVVNNHTRSLRVLMDYSRRLEGNQKQLIGEIYAVAEMLELESLLSSLEVLRMEEERGTDVAFTQLSLCQTGRVTSQLLPTNFIRALSKDGEYGEALTYQWYAEHLRVEGYVRMGSKYYCSVKIPLVKPEAFLYSSVHTYSVKREGLYARVYQNIEVALGTVSGNLFYPKECHGSQPQVCKTGMTFNQGEELCTRGLLSGNEKWKAKCPVELTKIEVPHALHASAPNVYAVYAYDEILTERCPQQAPAVENMKEGLYLLEVRPTCQVESARWRLAGVATAVSNTTSSAVTTVKLPTFSKINVNWIAAWEGRMEENGLQRIEVASIDTEAPEMPEFIDLTVLGPNRTGILIWTLIGVVLMLLIGGCSYCCYRISCLANCCSKCRKEGDEHTLQVVNQEANLDCEEAV